MTSLVQVAVAGNVTEAEELQSILLAAGIESSFEMAVEHQPDARDAIEALTEPDEIYDE